jgi:hypothetical protein
VIIEGLEMDETITFQTNDKSCILEVDAWELLWYMSPLKTSETLLSDPPMSSEDQSDVVEIDMYNYAYTAVDIYIWSSDGVPTLFTTLPPNDGEYYYKDSFVGACFTVEYQDPCTNIDTSESHPNDCASTTPYMYYPQDDNHLVSCVDNSDDDYYVHVYLYNDYHFDVWLTADGQANICENKWSRAGAAEGDLLDWECGDRPDAICWEWNICGDSDDPHKTA